jgi:predicted RNase H-like HicB family nuclease
MKKRRAAQNMSHRIKRDKDSLELTVEVLLIKEGDQWVSYAPSLQLTSYGDTQQSAKEGFQEALEIFIEHTVRKGTLERLLLEYGWILSKSQYAPPPALTQNVTHLLQRPERPKVYSQRVPIPAAVN